MKKSKAILILVFIALVIVQMIGSWTGNIWFEYLAKPLLLPWMALYFLLYSAKGNFKWMVLLAFFFSWTGDVLLMLSASREILFYAGVGGFFMAQLFYILVFSNYFKNQKKGFIIRKPLVLIPYILYLIGIIVLLFPGLDGFMRPIIVIYGGSLIAMAIAALNLRGKVPTLVFNLIFWGSILFVLSDTMLAVNKFQTELPKSDVLIMSTYIAAQLLILLGLVKKEEAPV